MLKISRNYIILGLCFSCLYLLGIFFPNYWWAFHSISFLSPVFVCALLVITALTIAFSNHKIISQKINSLLQDLSLLKSNFWLLLTSLGFFFLFYHFQIFKDYYGEAYLLQNTIQNIPKEISQRVHDELFSFSLNPWAGQRTIFSFITHLAYYLNRPYIEIFRWFDAIFGSLFIFSWIFFIKKQVNDTSLKVILFLAIATAPILLNFFGHLEINAPVYFINSLWIQSVIYFYDQLNLKRWVLLFLLFIVAIKFHAIALLFLPILILCAWKLYNETINLTWPLVIKFLLIPIFTIGLVAYFFIFKDHVDNRVLDYTAGEYEHIFLPLFSPEAPLDRYNLFSWNHVFDYFNVVFLWSPVAIFLIVVLIGFNRKKIEWNKPEVIISGTVLILFVVFFFMVNPLLSMQMDWDLFSFPAPILYAFVIVCMSNLRSPLSNTPQLLIIALAIGLLSIPFFSTHFNRKQLSEKLISLGKSIYPSYYVWSSQTINYGLLLMDNDEDVFVKRNEIIFELESTHQIEGYNQQLAKLYRVQGGNLLKQKNMPKEAYSFLDRALALDPSDKIARFWQMETCMNLESFQKAYDHSVALNHIEFPDKKRASIALVECALFADYYDNALLHSGTHLQNFPNDSTMMEINYRLLNNIEVKSLKEFFIFERNEPKDN